MAGRGMTSAMLTALAGNPTLCHLVTMELDSGTLFFTDAGRNITYSGDTFTGNGNLLSISDISEHLEPKGNPVSITLSGANLANYSTALGEFNDIVNREVTIKLAAIDSSGAVVVAPVVMYAGFISNWNIKESLKNKKATLTWILTNKLTGANNKAGALMSDSAQQSAYPGDLGFSYSNLRMYFNRWYWQNSDIFDYHDYNTGLEIERDTLARIPIAYGFVSVQPKQIVYENYGVGASFKTIYYFAFVLSVGECESLESILLASKSENIELLGNNFHSGTTSQAADSDLTTLFGSDPDFPWTSAHQLKDVCYIVAWFEWKDPQSLIQEIPSIIVNYKGVKLFDPRTSTTAYSANPALIIRHYLVYKYGYGFPTTDLDSTSFEDAADHYEIQKSPYSGAGHTINQLDLNIIVDTNKDRFENLKRLLKHARAWLRFANGKWYLIPQQDDTAVYTLDESNLENSMFEYEFYKKEKKLNTVHVSANKIRNSSNTLTITADEQIDVTVSNSAYLAEDNSVTYDDTLNLDGFWQVQHAKQLANYELKISRYQDKLKIKTHKADMIKLEVGDVFILQRDAMSWTTHEFRVHGSTYSPKDFSYMIEAQTHESSAYSAIENSQTDESIPDIPKVTFNTVAAPASLSVSSGTNELIKAKDGTIITRAHLIWSASSDIFLDHYEVEFKKSSAGSYDSGSYIVPGTVNEWFIQSQFEEGVNYDFRIRAVNTLGFKSSYDTVTNHTFVGKSEPPPDLLTFQIDRQPDGTRQYSWTYSTPLPADFKGVELRYKNGTATDWDDMIPIPGAELLAGEIKTFESNQLAAGTYDFAAKMVDTSGIKSTNAVFIVGETIGDPRIDESFDIINLLSTGWSGTKTQCEVASDTGYLIASDQNTWSNLTTWTAWTTWYQNPYTSITYQHGTIDIGAIVPFIPLVTIKHNGTALTVEEQHSDDDVSYSSWATAGTLITARYVRIRFTVNKSSGLITVTDGTIILSGSPITEEIEDLDTSTLAACVPTTSCSTSGYRIAAGDIRLPIAKTYSKIKKVDVTLQNVGAGWSWELIDKDVNVGPRIKIYNSSSTLADATIDASIKGV